MKNHGVRVRAPTARARSGPARGSTWRAARGAAAALHEKWASLRGVAQRRACEINFECTHSTSRARPRAAHAACARGTAVSMDDIVAGAAVLVNSKHKAVVRYIGASERAHFTQR